jgi:hypothetical protein
VELLEVLLCARAVVARTESDRPRVSVAAIIRLEGSAIGRGGKDTNRMREDDAKGIV